VRVLSELRERLVLAISQGPDPRGVAADDKQAFLESAAIFGSPDTVARKIQEHAEQGIPNLATWLSFGFMEPEQTKRSLRLFIDEVMPRCS
jgi:alkanesulfonate monooxygenase SsuD/methylene tetrahydromethanopterin reductase-like flavin-dependent oxidoreductase (luciferase family)